MSSASQTETFASIRQAIRIGDEEQARTLLRGVLKQSPSAEAWYLASLVALSDEQAIKFLERAVQLDPNHHEAANTLDRMRDFAQPLYEEHKSYSPEVSASAADATYDQTLLDNTVAYFKKNGWKVSGQFSNSVMLEKKPLPGMLPILIVGTLFGALGAGIMIAFASSKKAIPAELQMTADGKVQIRGNGKRLTISQVAEAKQFVGSVASMSWIGLIAAAAISGCIGSLLVYYLQNAM